MASLLLLGVALAAVPSVTGTSAGCGVVVEQDDARSQRDAGASPERAVELSYEDEFPASISYPQGPVLDAEDWFHLSWDSDTPAHRVMVNVSTRALGLSYLSEQRLASPHLGLEAYEPGAEKPAHVGVAGEDGVVRLDFLSERSEWDVRVFLPGVSESACPTSHEVSASGDVQSYNLYWGCDPHCVHVQAG